MKNKEILTSYVVWLSISALVCSVTVLAAVARSRGLL